MNSFTEFLKQKAGEPGWKDRKIRRGEWLAALNQLFSDVKTLLEKADPEGILEIEEYVVERVEKRLGVYDAPALKIRLGTQSVHVVPVGLDAPKPSSVMNLLTIPMNRARWGDLSGGRVDVTNEDRRHVLLRSTDGESKRWYVIHAGSPHEVRNFDQSSLEAILLDLFS